MGATRSTDLSHLKKFAAGIHLGLGRPRPLISSLFTTIPPLHPSTTCHTMDQPQLPPECIMIIIRFVHNNNDKNTMANLLRVNKTICAATLPFLYKDCFSLSMRPHIYTYQMYQSPETQQLVRTLLRQFHSQSRIPDILRLAFLSPDDQTDVGSTAQPPPPPVFNYGRFLSTVNVNFESIRSMFESICNSSPLMNYAATNRLYEKYKDLGYIGNNGYSSYKDTPLREALKVDIYHQLT